MSTWRFADRYQLQILEKPQEMTAVEELQRLVWPNSETDVIPDHVLLAVAHNGGLLIGAYDVGDSEIAPAGAPLVGFVFGFPGLYYTPDGPRPKHCSHQMGVHPLHRDQGLGFALKRAQWQMVRHQGLDRVTWTYDPLLSRNAHLNITRLGAVCNTYLREEYGEMRDGINAGLPSDRFQVDWWVNTRRVYQRLSKNPRRPLKLSNFISAETPILNPAQFDEDDLPHPQVFTLVPGQEGQTQLQNQLPRILLVEIPADFSALKAANRSLSLEWRLHTRTLFEDLFTRGYLVTDFVHLPGKNARSYYALTYGESTL